MKKQDPSVYCYVKNKKWGGKCHVNTNFKKTEVAVLILSKGDFITKLQGYYIITVNSQKNSQNSNICAPKTSFKYHKQTDKNERRGRHIYNNWRFQHSSSVIN